MKNKDYVKNFDSFVDSLLENRDIKKGTPQFDLIKKNILSFKELFEQSVAELEKKFNDETKKLSKGSKKYLDALIELARGKDSKEVKLAVDPPSTSRNPWHAILDWFSAYGDPNKIWDGYSYVEPDEAWTIKFKDRKPTIDINAMIKCMDYWNGKMEDTQGSELQAIKILESLSNPEYVKTLMERFKGRPQGRNPIRHNFDLFGDKGLNPAEEVREGLKFDQNLIVEKSKILLEKAKKTFDKTGKKSRRPIGFYIPDHKDGEDPRELLIVDKNLCLVPIHTFKIDDRYTPDSVDNPSILFTKDIFITSFWLWYKIISNEDKFKKLLARLDDTTYIYTSFVKITDKDKIDIIKGIYSESEEKFKKNKSIGAVSGIYGASSIMLWPKRAVETMPSSIVQPTEGGQTPEVEKIWDFAWPYAQKDGENLAMTYFKNDSATIEDGRDKDVANAVKMIMDKIKNDKGELLKLTYRIVASTSDEPSKYQQNGVIGGEWLPKNNEYLVVARAKTIEDALNKAITTYSIPKEKVTKDTEALSPNNTLGGTAVYEKMKSMRSGTEQQKADYKKLFAQPKHSGILFNVEYLTKDSGETPPDEEVIQPYSVIGEWVYEITWTGMGSSSRKRRRTRSRKPIKGINWGKLFPDIPVGGGSSVRDLCAAYG